jgi:molecular chaperone GrpE
MEMKEPFADSSEKNQQAGVVDEPSAGDWTSALDTVTAERDRLVEENNELTELLKRRQAEFDNFRRRSERERAETLEFANTESVRAILPVLDDFERALKVESTGPEYARGMEMIYQRLKESLKKLGLEPMDSKGGAFDPHIHHAVDMVETDEAEDHTVLEEYQQGYNFRGRLLRPAMVKVAVKKQ